MSVFTTKTGVSSILKAYSPVEREKSKEAAINRVRFELPRNEGLVSVLTSVSEQGNFLQYDEFVSFLHENNLKDSDFICVISDARKSIHLLGNNNFSTLVEAILSLSWTNRDKNTIDFFQEFVVDLLISHNKYSNFSVRQLVSYWLPGDTDNLKWNNGCPNEEAAKGLTHVHKLLRRLLKVMPMLFETVTVSIEDIFPYYKRPSFVVAGYIHNLLWLLKYRPDFTKLIMEILLKRLLVFDVNAPRNEIEEMEDDDIDENMAEEAIFQLDDCSHQKESEMLINHPVGEILDICMEKIFDFSLKLFESTCKTDSNEKSTNLGSFGSYFKIILDIFENVILPSHNTHHVQFLMFYCCSFRPFLLETCLNSMWKKLINPNASAPIRKASVGYIASFLARAKFIPESVLRMYLVEMCNWCHQYIERSDAIRSNISLKANMVFFSVCQAIFYIIAFRSRDLTSDKKSLLFLQSLQLSALVTCSFNPLRVCLPAVATTFAGVTRTYQLAYCYTILERNARRKLATVYTNETMAPEDCLESFFPFDPYLLKRSGIRISPLYLQYRASEGEENNEMVPTISSTDFHHRRKRGDSEMLRDDVDDFIVTDKRSKFQELSKSSEKEIQFTYGMSPGFHI